MQRIVLFSLTALALFLLTACGDYANTVKGDVGLPNANGPNPNGLPNANTVPKPGTPSGYPVSATPVVISEVLVDPMGPDTGAQFVELFNSSSLLVDIGGWTVTDGVTAYTFPYGFRIDATARVVLHIGAAGADTDAERFAPYFPTLDAVQGSLALLRGGNEIVDYVQWGGTPNAYEVAAASVGEWSVGDFVVRPAEGLSEHYDGSASNSSAWHESSPTPGN